MTKILVIEDEDSLRETAIAILRSNGFEATGAATTIVRTRLRLTGVGVIGKDVVGHEPEPVHVVHVHVEQGDQ